MNFHDFEQERHFRALWDAVAIARAVPYTLFTFGDSDLPYYLVVDAPRPREPVSVSQGVVKVTRPMLVTPYNAPPEFRNFFDDEDLAGMASFLMARTAAFSNLKLANEARPAELISDSLEEVVARLNRQLDADDEDRVAILTAPHKLGKVAVLKYAAERIMESAPGNIQELREKGLLPD
jgi:hypothetical protein